MTVARDAVVATSNAHKVAELAVVLEGWRLAPLDRGAFPPEDGASYEDNARLKARFGREHAPGAPWVIGEDSGIESDALDGRPGVASARWAADGVTALLEALDGVQNRRGRYRCVIVAIAHDGREVVAEGVLEGRIEGPPRGTGGFGYDPIFVPDGHLLTVAELGDAWKREHSHRARAARAFAQAVGELRDGS